MGPLTAIKAGVLPSKLLLVLVKKTKTFYSKLNTQVVQNIGPQLGAERLLGLSQNIKNNHC